MTKYSIWGIVLCLLLFISSNAFAACSAPGKGCANGESQEGDWCYTVSGGEVTIRGAEAPKKGQIDLLIPSEIDGMPVTTIAASAFKNCHASVGTVVIPDSVITIESEAFRNINLQRVTFGSSVAFIGEWAFRGNDTLTRAYFFGDAPSMGDGVFREASNAFSICYAQWSEGFTSPTWSPTPADDYSTEMCITPCRHDFECPPGYECVDGYCLIAFSYFFDLNGELTITGYIGQYDDVVIPETLDGAPVVHLGAWSFYERDDLTSVTVADSVETIGAYAFSGCTALASVTIPDGIASIGSLAFYQCDSLSVLNIPAAAVDIGAAAFNRCVGLSAINVHADNPIFSSVDGVFYTKDQSVLIQYPSGKTGAFTVPASVNMIVQFAFSFNDNLPSVEVPAAVVSIARGAFAPCASLAAVNIAAANPNYSSVDGVFYNKSQDELILYPPAKTGAFTIPGTVTQLADGAFAGCVSLIDITIPASVTYIGDAVFEACTGLTSIAIPDTVTYIGRGVFYQCTNLQTVTIGSGITSVPDGIIFENEVVGVFAGCTALESIIVPGTLASIGNYAFYDCTALSAVYFLGDAPALGTYVFENCAPGLSVCYTGAAFGFSNPWNGYSAGECYPPCDIGDDCPVGYECVNNECRIVSTCVDTTDCPAGYDCVNGSCQNMVLSYTVSNGLATITGYTGIGTHLEIPAEIDGFPVVSIGRNAFRNDIMLISVTIPEGITSIQSEAFFGCINLAAVVIPDSVMSIGNIVFYNCIGLRSVVLGSGVQSIGTGAFYNCSALSSLNIPVAVGSIGQWALSRLISLSSIDVDPDNQNYVSDNGVLYNADRSLLVQYPAGKSGAFVIPGTVTGIGVFSFAWSGVTNVDIPDGVVSIGAAAFYYSGISSQVVIPDSVISIGNSAFRTCLRLKRVTIGSGVAELGDLAFADCAMLTEAYFEAHAPTVIGIDVFARANADFMVCRPDGAVGFDEEPWLSYNAQVCSCDDTSDCDIDYVCALGECMYDLPPVITYGPVPSDRTGMWYGLSQDPSQPTPMYSVEEAVGWIYSDDFGSCISQQTITGMARYRVPGGSWMQAPVVHWYWVPAFGSHFNAVPAGEYEFETCVTDCANQTVCSGVKYIEIVE